MLNPLAQMKAFNANKKPQNEPKTTLKARGKANLPPTAQHSQKATQGENKVQAKAKPTPKPQTKHDPNGKDYFIGAFPQTSRQFQLMAGSIERCKRDYPNDYHHKHQQAKESREIAQALKGGVQLLQNLQKLTKNRPLADDEKAQANAFYSVAKYLSKHFREVAEYVDLVDKLPQSETPKAEITAKAEGVVDVTSTSKP